MKQLLLLTYLLFAGMAISAQSTMTKDSLLQLLSTANEDTAKIRLYINIQKQYANKNYDSSFFYLNKEAALAQKLKTDKFDYFINTGFLEYYVYNNNYKKALEHALKNKEIAEKANDMKLQARSYNNLAAVYNHFGQHKYGIESILKCLDISEKTKDSASFPIRNLTASHTYYDLKQFPKAIFYAKRAIQYGKQFNNSFAVMMGTNNLSACYAEMNMLDSSITINQQQLDYVKQEGDVVNIHYALINLCYDNFKTGNKKALENYSKELASYNKTNPDNKVISQVYNALALNSIAHQEYDHAKAQLDSGIVIAKSEEDPDALGNLYQNYAIFFYLQGKVTEGEMYSFRYDSLISAGNLKDLNFYTEELETKYETEKKEGQIKLQQAQIRQQSFLNYFLIAGAVALLLISLLGYRNYKNRQTLQQARIDELEKEKQLTAAEAVVKGEEQERSRLAKDLHDGLGGMLSGIKYSLNNMKGNLILSPDNAQAFERSIDMLNSSITEMRRVAHNMMPEILVRYGLDTALKEFCNEIDRSGVIRATYQSLGMDKASIDQSVGVTLYRIVQELVNNAIKHAAAANVLVQVHLLASEKIIAITVEDDGKGFDTDKLDRVSGIGWSNIQHRVNFLKGKLDLNSMPGKGTSVLIEIAI